ncbi:hypothetical protein EDC96DRAFT_513417 [Choanephora cucurbitarum]|nr:hypothetical protein EDC96DRAFT_513417 [Choanephora cucurbitarum]
MFKARKKKQHQYETTVEYHTMIDINQKKLNFNLLNDVQLSNDFRSSIIIPELNKDLDSNQQKHLAFLQGESELHLKPPIMTDISHDPKRLDCDGAKQYRDLAAWRQHRRHRHSNGLFGGKQRNKPKPTRRHIEDDSKKYIEEHNENKIEPQVVKHNFIEEDYEPDSDTEENYFFQDFSYDSKVPRPRKRNTGRKKQHTNPPSRFDLSSFAKDLHDNRLSVIQRESKIIMTEEDELELQKLLELQRQRMSMMFPELDNESTETFQAIPPLPSLEMIKSHQSTKKEKEIQTPALNSDHDSVTTTSASTNGSICDNYMLDDTIKMSSEEAEEEGEEQQQILEEEELKQMEKPVTQHISNKEAYSQQWIENDSNKIALDEEQDIKVPQMDTILEPINASNAVAFNLIESNNAADCLSETTLTKSSSMEHSSKNTLSVDDAYFNNQITSKSKTQSSFEQISRKNSVRESNNANDLTSIAPEKPSLTPLLFLNEEYVDPVKSLETNQKIPHPPNSNKVSRGLFGSLRQANKSQNGGNSFKGLVRNFSAKEFSRLSKSQKESVGMSRAAMAVIQHNVAKQEKDYAFCNIFEESEQTQQKKRPKSDNNNPLVQLLARASSSTRGKKNNATKVVNMNADNKNKRAEIVRKTIIYVQPDSLQHMLKNGAQLEDIPALPSARNTIVSEGSSSFDDDVSTPKEYAIATKISRQTSVRKRIVDVQQNNTVNHQQGSERKRFQLYDMEEKSNEVEQLHPHNNYMEGVELREMSDGTVIWGIVKKEGNRKSFFAPNLNKSNRCTNEDESFHQIDTMKKTANTAIISPTTSKAILVSAPDGSLSPPPIPRRSPRRRNTAKKVDQPKETETSIYYSDKVTLPNLLKMMQGHDQYPGDMMDEEVEIEEGSDFAFDQTAMTSVDDQLDSFMRDLLHQQQEQEQKQISHF